MYFVLNYICFECGFEGGIQVEWNSRIVCCPHCSTRNDFWLEG